MPNLSKMTAVDVCNWSELMPTGVDSAVGVSERSWYVAIVKHNSEIKCAEKLRNLGYECYVAAQEETRIWKNGRCAKANRIVLPSIVFVRCSEQERLRSIVTLPFIFRFMTDKAAASNVSKNCPVAKIPQSQIDVLKFMLGQSDVKVEFVYRYIKGQQVRVVRGQFSGLQGTVSEDSDGKKRLYVDVSILGCASVEIDAVNIELIG